MTLEEKEKIEIEGKKLYTQKDLDKSLHDFKKEIVGLLKSHNVDKKIIHEINNL